MGPIVPVGTVAPVAVFSRLSAPPRCVQPLNFLSIVTLAKPLSNRGMPMLNEMS